MEDVQNIPIDIHHSKLLDWLIDRRHCMRQWQPKVLAVRKKINTAIQDMPPVDEISQLLAGTHINYFHCLKIVELLGQTEDGAKNIFGMYSSQRMKDWKEIIKLYEVDCIYLAETSQTLMRNVGFEVPALKKQISRCRQSQNDCVRREAEYIKNSSEMKERYKLRCRQLGIEGNKVKKELLDLVRDLPETYSKISRDATKLKEAVSYYKNFLSFTLGRSDVGEDCLPVLQYIMEHGNVTGYEYNRGCAPVRVDEVKLDLSMEDDEEQVEEEQDIDWGDLNAEEVPTDEIDFDISVEASSNEIDFGESGDAGIIMGGAGESDNVEEGVATGDEARTLLDFRKSQNQFIDDITELESFLVQRLDEMKDTDNVIASSQFDEAPESIQLDYHPVSLMLEIVQEILNQITSRRIQDLILIRNSPKHVNRLSESVKKFQSDGEKMLALSRLMVQKREEALEEQRLVEPRLDLIRNKTKELQKQIQGEISKKYQNRRVNIMGEINQM